MGSKRRLLRLSIAAATVAVGMPVLTVGLPSGTAAASVAAGPGWAIQPAAAPNVPNGVNSAVSCTSASACTAVGFFLDAAGHQVALAERWNGISWVVETAPDPTGAKDTELNGVSCVSATDCVAVGYAVYPTAKGGGHQGTLAERWDGKSWSLQTTPSPTGAKSGFLNGVSCTSATACTTVGSFVTSTGANVTLAERWNGTSWLVESTPNPSGPTDNELNGVSCVSPTSCTAVGYAQSSGGQVTLAERWNGAGWSIQTTPPNPTGGSFSTLDGVSCASSTACTAVGYSVDSSFDRLTLAERWNGTGWTIQTTPNVTGQPFSVLSGVSCASATACTAVGSSYGHLYAGLAPLTERWNGTSWSLQSTPNATRGAASLGGVSCPSATACISVGSAAVIVSGGNYFGGSYFVTVAERWAGTKWSLQSTPNPAGATYSAGLHAVSCTSTTACTAVGSFTNSAGNIAPLAERWTGTSWSIEAAPSPAGQGYGVLNAVSCSSATDCTAVGSSLQNLASTTSEPLAEHWNGTSWSIEATPKPNGSANNSLTGVSCTSATACTAVGLASTGGGQGVTLAERWNGTSWTIQSTPNPTGARGSDLLDVSCTSATACTAVGGYGSSANSGTLAERWNGTSWTIQTTPNPTGENYDTLSGVSCTTATTCTAVGSFTKGPYYAPTQGTLAERWDGTSWSIQATPSPTNSSALNQVSCSSTTTCTAVGSNYGVTLAERWNGSSWTIQTIPNPPLIYDDTLNGVSCTSATACTAVGGSVSNIGPADTIIGSALTERYS